MNDLLAQVRKFRSLELNPHYQRLFDAVIEELEVRASVQPSLRLAPQGAYEDLLALAKQCASECGECAGVGITPDDEPCEECRFIREVIAKAEGAA